MKIKRAVGNLPDLYRAQMVDLLLFGAIHAMRRDNPERPIKEIIICSLEAFNLEKEIDFEIAQRAYYETNSKFLKTLEPT